MALISLHGKHLFSLFLPARDEVLKSDANEALPSLCMVKDQMGYMALCSCKAVSAFLNMPWILIKPKPAIIQIFNTCITCTCNVYHVSQNIAPVLFAQSNSSGMLSLKC